MPEITKPILPIWEIIRFAGTQECTISQWLVNTLHQCFGLEDQYHKIKIKHETRIPEGIYELRFYTSPRFSPIYGHDMIQIINVPGFENIEVHPLNTEKQTDGCVGPGRYIGHDGKNFVTVDSRTAYMEFYAKLAPLMKKETQYVKISSTIWNPYEEDPSLINVTVPPFIL